jgi:hypothetical protein
MAPSATIQIQKNSTLKMFQTAEILLNESQIETKSMDKLPAASTSIPVYPSEYSWSSSLYTIHI